MQLPNAKKASLTAMESEMARFVFKCEKINGACTVFSACATNVGCHTSHPSRLCRRSLRVSARHSRHRLCRIAGFLTPSSKTAPSQMTWHKLYLCGINRHSSGMCSLTLSHGYDYARSRGNFFKRHGVSNLSSPCEVRSR
jgi:hypothetical protein